MFYTKYGYEEWLNEMFCEMMEEKEREIQRLDKIISAQSKEIKSKDNQIKSKDNQIKLKDNQIKSKDNQIKLKDNQIKELDDQINIKQIKILARKLLDFDDLYSPEAQKIFKELVSIDF